MRLEKAGLGGVPPFSPPLQRRPERYQEGSGAPQLSGMSALCFLLVLLTALFLGL